MEDIALFPGGSLLRADGRSSFGKRMEENKEMGNEENGAMSEEKQSAWQQISKSFDKYADDLANLFGGLTVLSSSFLLILVIVNVTDFFSRWKISTPWMLTVLIAASGAVSAAAFGAMLYFAKRFDQNGRETEEEIVYRITAPTLETLKATGVGLDVVKALRQQLDASPQKVLEMSLSPASPDNWLANLKSDLGDTRVAEFEPLILKYSRRTKKVDQSNAAPVAAAPPRPAVSVN